MRFFSIELKGEVPWLVALFVAGITLFINTLIMGLLVMGAFHVLASAGVIPAGLNYRDACFFGLIVLFMFSGVGSGE